MRRFVTAVLVAAVVLTMSGTMLAGDAPDPAPGAQQTVDPLIRVLQSKGVLSAQEAQALAAVPLAQQRDQLTNVLLKKGVISSSDLQGGFNLPNERLVAFSSSASLQPAVMIETASQGAPQAAAPKPPAVIPAVAPIRVAPVDSPKRDGLVPAIKLGPVKATPYGYVRMAVVEDSSAPYGIDFVLPGLITDSGPDAAPQFKVKARNTRLGGNFEWLDPSNKLTLTGKIEFDFEGNYTAVANRGISALRSSMPSIRLAFGRFDYAASADTTIYGVFGQDWTPFGSSVLPNTLEGTGVGIGFGSLYERGQMVKGGIVYKFAGSRTPKLLLEAAIVQPSSGNQPLPFPGNNALQIPGGAPAGTLNTSNTFTIVGCATAPCGTVTIPQIANNGAGLTFEDFIGERQGPDSNRPDVEGRIALQFQLDKAPGVAPAQLILSGDHGRRSSLALGATIPTLNATAATAAGIATNIYTAAFGNAGTISHGVRQTSTRWGVNPQFQLPTRWFTLIGSYYTGGDLRWFFAGQVLSFYNDTTGLANTVTLPGIDGSSSLVLATRAGVPVVAPQRAVRTKGGFLELGLPLSRLAGADPKGRNAGWTMNLHYGRDDVNNRDLRKTTAASIRDRGDWAFANIMYKLNNWVTFAFEESYYGTRAFRAAACPGPKDTVSAACYGGTLFRGNPTRSWHDIREEFSTTFTF